MAIYTVIYNDNNTITSNNMTMFITNNLDSVGNKCWNVKDADGNLVTSVNFSETEAWHFIKKDKGFNTTVGDELTRLGIE